MAGEMLWSGWGDPAEVVQLAPEVLTLLEQALGVQRPRPTVALEDVRLPPSRLAEPVRERLAAAVGAEHVRVDSEARVRHTRGKSTPDLLRIRGGEADDAPDAVVLPGAHEEVLELLRVCTEERVAVVPFGGGTSVVGGLAPRREGFGAVLALDLRRLRRLLELDEVSRTATLEPGLRGPEAEALLAARGYTIGHHPQSFHFATLGGFAATRSSGQASAGYGRFDERVVGLRVATPRGTVELGRAPRSAAGPDLRQLFLGSEGTLGVATALRVEVSPAPAVRVYEGWRFGAFAEGARALRRLVQDGPVPTVLRLSDEAETALDLAGPTEPGERMGSGAGGGWDPISGGRSPSETGAGGAAVRRAAPGAGGAGGCLCIAGYEGAEADVASRRAGATAVLRACGAEPDASAGERWERGRYAGPYLRDALLDAGALVETLETATFWSGLETLYDAVTAALRDTLTALGSPPVVLCHVSHVYRSGASLYWTVGAAQLDDPLAQWGAAKRAASDAILAAGGTITHHHGVGRDHCAHFAQEVGPLGVETLRAAKAALDPAGILNPGILLV